MDIHQREIPIENLQIFAFFLIFHLPLFPRYNDIFTVCMSKDVRAMWPFILKQESKIMQVCVSCVQESSSHGHFPFFFFLTPIHFTTQWLLAKWFAELCREFWRNWEASGKQLCVTWILPVYALYSNLILQVHCSLFCPRYLETGILSPFFQHLLLFFHTHKQPTVIHIFIASSEYSILVFLNSLYDLMISSFPT